MERIKYFDHAATTYVKEEVFKEMLPYFSINFGNASSPYNIGRISKRAIEQARARVARLIGAKTNEIYFTSCGSESDNLAIKGIAKKYRNKGNHIITSKIEHPAVLNTCKTLEKDGLEITYLNVDKDGLISIGELGNSIKDSTILVSVMFANNEIGTIQPIKEIAEITKKHDIFFHTDSVQAIGNVKIDVEELGIDLLSMSGHKFYGPKGVGVLYVRNGIEFERIQDGGHQERNKRAGTENVAGIVGIGKAAELATENIEKYNRKMISLRNYFIEQIEKNFPNAKLNGSRTNRLPGNCNFSFQNVDAEEVLFKLDAKGICVSTGSACSTGSTMPSHVLLAIGLTPENANGALRITFGDENTKEDVDYLVKSLMEIIK